jgi:transposase
MVQRFHGIDRHQRSSTISGLNREGTEVTFIASCANFSTYVEKLGAEDAVVMEVGMGSLCWADQIEARGASCYVIDPYRFRIIKDSWNKNDKYDSRTMAKALWVQTVSGEFGLPVVWKPTMLIRELRKLFAQYMDLNVHTTHGSGCTSCCARRRSDAAPQTQ